MRYAVFTLPQPGDGSRTYDQRIPQLVRHPVYGWLGFRPALAQHTAAEHQAIRRWATGRSSLVEIGVAEGVSALAIRETMAENGHLYLVDPFHLSRVPLLNFMKRAAHRAVSSCTRGRVTWIEAFSSDAARTWNTMIDFLLIDGDHSEAAVKRDWEEWSRFLRPRGVVLFHDARIFEGGWTNAQYGPVALVNSLFRSNEMPGWAIVEEIDSLTVIERTALSS